MATTKAYQKLKANLAQRPIYFWSNEDIKNIKIRIRCSEHVEEPKGKKLTARVVWNESWGCDVCGYKGRK